jgi:hypothetical protein
MRNSCRSVVGAQVQDPAQREVGIWVKLVCGFVVARRAAGIAIHQTVGAHADINHRLAEAAVFLALAVRFALLALRATDFRGTGGGA